MLRRILIVTFGVLLLYTAAAYLLVPDLWKHYGPHPALETFPKTSVTSTRQPGDPLNVGFVGTDEELMAALQLSGWQLADPLRILSDLKIAESVLLNQSYPTAPVSRLYLFGRPQDMAFEKQADGSPRHRHHARFWKTPITGENGKPLWIGSATFDRNVGLSHTTGQITHHIAPDLDAERDTLIRDLSSAGRLSRIYQVSGIGPSLNGRNGAGDPYYTDGEITIGVLAGSEGAPSFPAMDPNPMPVELKNRSWELLKDFLQSAGQAGRSV